MSADKAATWEQPEHARLAHAGSPVVPPATPDTPVTAGIQYGISDNRQGPFRSTEFHGTNSWVGLVDGVTTVVVAGGQPTDAADPFSGPRQAAVYVYTQDTQPAAGTSGTHPQGVFVPTPDPEGDLAVTGAQGAILTLSIAGQPTTYTFDAATRTFSYEH